MPPKLRSKPEPGLAMESIAFKCADGTGNAVQLYRCASKTDEQIHSVVPVVVFAPAMGIPATKYNAFCLALVEHGVHAACFDLRGLGNSSVRASRAVDFSYATLVEQDFSAALKVIARELPASPIVLAGHSLGGQISALYIAYAQQHLSQHGLSQADQRDNTVLVMPRGLALIASCSIYHKRWPFPSSIGLLIFTQFCSLLAKIMGYFPGKSVGFGGLEARSLIADWAYNARTGRYDIKATADNCHQHASNKSATEAISTPVRQASDVRTNYDELLAQVATPLLSINFAEDTFAPLFATRHLAEKLKPMDWQRCLFDKATLGTRSADHYQWMRAPNLPAKKVAEWAKSLVQNSAER